MSYTPKHGDLLLTRYNDESRNTTPGHWNHSAIYCDGYIVEALIDQGVVMTEYNKWLKGVDKYTILRCADRLAMVKAADFAPTLLNKKYSFWASIVWFIGWFRDEDSLNCVMVPRLSYKEAFKKDPGWVVPDNIFKDPRFLEVKAV